MTGILPPNKKYAYLTPARKGFITSYPHFQQWQNVPLDEFASLQPLNIYIHIPFCAQRCGYCYYRTVKGGRKPEIDRYVQTLCREIDLVVARLRLPPRPVMALYMGGGTPTILNEQHFTAILERLQTHFEFANPEFTVEAEPMTLTATKAAFLQTCQVNRISMGVQSFNDHILHSAQRQDTEAKAVQAVELAKTTRAAVNIDLLSGLAGETQETWAETIARALSLQVESISVYKMELYANSEYYKQVRAKTIALPSDDQELDFMRYALNRFTEADYQPWSIFGFTQHGRYGNVYASSMWQGTDCYAFGVSAFSGLGAWSFQNTNDLEKYMTLVESGELPISRGHKLSSLDQIIRTVLLEMKLTRLNLQTFQSRYGFRLEALCATPLAQLQAEGLISVTSVEIRLTQEGVLQGDYVGKFLANQLITLY